MLKMKNDECMTVGDDGGLSGSTAEQIHTQIPSNIY